MQIKKISLANVQGKMSRNEMKAIMAGSGGGYGDSCWGPQGCNRVMHSCCKPQYGFLYPGTCTPCN
jgi:hypothetical protein